MRVPLKPIILISLLLIACEVGCFHYSHKYYSIRFENNGSREIEKIEMNTNSGAHTIEQFFSPGKVSVVGLQSKYSANAIYTISWQYDDNKKFVKKFDLRDELPADFKGHVVFSFNQENDVNFHQWMSPYQYDYSVELENKSKATIYNPFIKSSGGVLFVKYKDEMKMDDEIRVWNLKKFPANSIYTVSWTTENGKHYSKEFDLRNRISEDFSGVIQFAITKPDKIEYTIY